MYDFTVNKKLLPIKGYYFLWNAGTAPVVPFMTIYARQLGFSGFVVGIIYTILPFSGMLAKPLLGAVADRYKCQKLIFLTAQLVAAVSFFAMIFLPEVPNTAKVHLACDYSEVFMDSCNHNNDTVVAQRLNELNNATLQCKLNCYPDLSETYTMCKYWDNSFCGSSDAVSFTAHVPMNMTETLNGCIYFKINNATFESQNTRYPLCPEEKISTKCNVECNSHVMNEILTPMKDTHVIHQYQFWFLLVTYLIGWIGQAISVSVGDAICFQLLGDQAHKYGYQRMYGALGWGLFSIVSGILVDVFSEGSDKKTYGPVFGIGVALLVLCIITSCQVQYSQQKMSASILRDIARLLSNLQIFIFMLWCICIGLCTALMWNFLFWLLEDLAKKHDGDIQLRIKTIEGLVMGIQCLGGELPFFFLSSWILKRIGHINAMSVVLLVFGIRFVLYSVVTNPWWFLPIELCNGPTFGLFYATMASYASIVAPPGTETTTQGLVGAVFEGLGVSLGSFIGGSLYEKLEGPLTFRIFGVGALTACLFHAIIQYFIQQNRQRKKDSSTKYAAPKEALRMINDDQQELTLPGFN